MLDKVVIGMPFWPSIELRKPYKYVSFPGGWKIVRPRLPGFSIFVNEKPPVSYFILRFNGSQMLYGDNFLLLHRDDLPVVTEQLNESLRDIFSIVGLPSVLDWLVSRIEYPLHLQMKPGFEKNLLQSVGKLRLEYLKCDSMYLSEGTVYFKSKGRSVIAYDKSKQMANE